MGYKNIYSECEWRPHPYLPDIDVSDNGRVISYKSGKPYELKPSNNGGGYYTVSIGLRNPRYIHRLVAETYIPNPHGYPEVNHINGNKSDNRVENLEWCTRSYNKRHACDTGLRGDLDPVQILETGEIFKSHSDCARAIGGTSCGIGDCKYGKNITHRGYHFKFFDNKGTDDSERAYYNEKQYGKPLPSQCKGVIATDLWTGETAYFDSIHEAASELGLKQASISHVLRGDQSKTGHYRFEYAGREEKIIYGDDDSKLFSWLRIGIR